MKITKKLLFCSCLSILIASSNESYAPGTPITYAQSRMNARAAQLLIAANSNPIVRLFDINDAAAAADYRAPLTTTWNLNAMDLTTRDESAVGLMPRYYDFAAAEIEDSEIASAIRARAGLIFQPAEFIDAARAQVFPFSSTGLLRTIFSGTTGTYATYGTAGIIGPNRLITSAHNVSGANETVLSATFFPRLTVLNQVPRTNLFQNTTWRRAAYTMSANFRTNSIDSKTFARTLLRAIIEASFYSGMVNHVDVDQFALHPKWDPNDQSTRADKRMHDIAILRTVQKMDTDRLPMLVEPTFDETATFTVGYPLGRPHMIKTSGRATLRGNLLIHNMAIFPGNSGGFTFNGQNKAIGMIAAGVSAEPFIQGSPIVEADDLFLGLATPFTAENLEFIEQDFAQAANAQTLTTNPEPLAILTALFLDKKQISIEMAKKILSFVIQDIQNSSKQDKQEKINQYWDVTQTFGNFSESEIMEIIAELEKGKK